MSAAATVLATCAAFMFGFGPAFCAAVWLSDRRDRRRQQPEPVRPCRLHTEWAQLRSAVDQARADIDVRDQEGTPLYDRMVCEQIEKAEGWV